MSIFKENILTPLLSIESFGIHNKPNGYISNEYIKYYVASLDFTTNKLFWNQSKIVYIPILFTDENEINAILKHYDNIFFMLRFEFGYYQVYNSDLYHISNFIDIDKIYNSEYKNAQAKQIDSFEIVFIVRDYKNYDIVINAPALPQYITGKTIIDVNKLISVNDNNNSLPLKYISDNSVIFPQIMSYSIKLSDTNQYNSIHNVSKFNDMLLYIDKLDDKNNKIKENLTNMYSKKTFMLVENK